MSTGRGNLITFEGGEGSGKSTQVKAIRERVETLGHEALVTREPGGTLLGEMLRLLARKPALARRFHRELSGAYSQGTEPLAELFLMSAARAQLVGAVIRPALEQNRTVLCDRYEDSTLAYQGYGRGLDLSNIRTVNRISTQGVRPALTFLIDIPPEVGLARKGTEPGRDAIGGETIAFHRRVRAGYLTLAAAEPDRWSVIDGLWPVSTITDAIWQRLAPLLTA